MYKVIVNGLWGTIYKEKKKVVLVKTKKATKEKSEEELLTLLDTL